MPTTDEGSEFVDIPDEEPEPHPSLDPERDPAGDPTHPHWQGHTHPWPKKAKNGLLTCPDCGAIKEVDRG